MRLTSRSTRQQSIAEIDDAKVDDAQVDDAPVDDTALDGPQADESQVVGPTVDDPAVAAEHAWDRCQALASSPDILSLFAAELERRGVVGEARNAKILYLAVVSRFLERIVSVLVRGPSAAGKSHLVAGVLKFFPAAAVHVVSAMTEKALIYSKEPLAHRLLVFYEGAGIAGPFASYLLRTLLSEGRLRYETPQGVIHREGPTGLILTTTSPSVHAENQTRLLALDVQDTPAKTRATMLATAQDIQWRRDDDREWHALQVWLAGGEHRVVVPYAVVLAQCIPPVAVRLSRDFPMLLALIRAHALLHRATRERDAEHRIVATLADYEAVYDLVADLFAEGLDAAVSDTIRETVAAVAELAECTHSPVSITQLAAYLKLDKSAVSRRVQCCVQGHYLINQEGRRGRPALLAIGEPLPKPRAVLPSPERLAAMINGAP